MAKKRKQSQACMRLKGELLELGSRHYDLERNDCEHVMFTRMLFRNGEIRPPICQHCGTGNEFPLNVGLEDGMYILRCTSCNQIILKEGG